MAAPASAYRDGKLNMGQPSDPKSHLIAILQTSKSVMLSRFYLDELVSVTLPDGTDGVVGAVIIGGANEEMHNITTRGGVGRVRVNGQTARLLNDAGLNTLAKLDIHTIKHAFANFFTVRVSGRSAYYLNSPEHGIQIKRSTENWGQAQTTNEGVVTQNTEITSRYFTIRNLYEIGTTVNIRAYILNAEGLYNSSVVSTTISEGIMQQVVSGYVPPNLSPCSDPTESPVVLMSDEDYTFLQTFTSVGNVNTGVFVYVGEPFENPLDSNGDFTLVPEGFYRGLDGVYQNVFYVSNTGEVLRRIVCVPVLPHLGYLSIIPGFATPENPNANPELVYVVDDVIATTYTVFGYVMEYVGGIPQGSQKAFNLTVNANTSTVVWNTKPTLNKVAGGKFRLINVYIDPNNAGTITQTEEI